MPLYDIAIRITTMQGYIVPVREYKYLLTAMGSPVSKFKDKKGYITVQYSYKGYITR